MINQTVLEGRITRDLEIKNSNTGISILNFNIAIDRPFKNKNGERDTDFINIVAFRKTAENIAAYFNKGDGISIVGRIQTRNYENNQGNRVYVTEVVADRFSFPIQNKNNSNNQQQNNNYNPQSNQPQRDKQDDDSNPFADVDFDDDDPFASNDDVTDIADDDLPF